MSRIDREDLRKLVREALKEALGGAGQVMRGQPPASPPGNGEKAGQGELQRLLRNALARGKPTEINVAMRSREDLDRFARDIAKASAEAEIKAAILAGTIGFLPVGPVAEAAPPAPGRPMSPVQLTKGAAAYEVTFGVLSESRVVEIARSHRKIVVGAEVVLTPLARDKARELKVELTRQKP